MKKESINQILKKYDNLIKSYQDYSYSEVLPILNKDRNEYDFILKKLHGFYFITNFISSKSGMKTKNVNENALFTLYNHASLSLLGVFYCLYNGLEIQASIILRTLFETYINCKYITKDSTAEKLRLFYNYQFIEKYLHYKYQTEKNPNYLQEMKIEEKVFKNAERDYNELIKDYNEKYPYHWAYKFFNDKNKNPSLLSLCKVLGDEYVDEYGRLYNITSIQSHPSSMLGNYFTIKNFKENVSINSPKFTSNQVTSGTSTVIFCGNVILDTINYFKPENYNELNIYIDHFISLTIMESHDFLKSKKYI